MKRQIIRIDEEKCNGCGVCVPECHEGALQMIDNKARLISDLFCDGLGACIGHCPEGAITIEEREAEPYNEVKVLEGMIDKPNVLKAHLKHLIDHNAMDYFREAAEYLKQNNISNPMLSYEKKPEVVQIETNGSGCPGSKTAVIEREHTNGTAAEVESQLRQWPVQLHLVNPAAPYFRGTELVIMSTCGPLANANVHNLYLKGRTVVVACPKLDYTEPYTEKLAAIFKNGDVKKAIVVIMEVPCCRGLVKFAYDAALMSEAGIDVEMHVMAIDGEITQKQIIYKAEIPINKN